MVKPITTLTVALLLLLLIIPVSAESEYCTPQENLTTTIDHEGNWYNITISSADCIICVDTGYGNVECYPCDTNTPIAGFSTNVTCGIVPFSVEFSDTSIGAGITDYFWDFGDGGNSTEEDPIYDYTVTGSYTINHSATNEYGTGWRNMSYLIQARAVGDTCESTTGYSTTYVIIGSNGIAWASPFILAGVGVGLIVMRRNRKDGDNNDFWG
jgi:PKD repeat protein